MERRHPEHPPAGELERGDLHDHRQRFDDEHAAHDEQHDFLPDDDGDGAQCSAQRQRAHVAHEHVRRIRVEPQEAQACARDRPADHGELPGTGDVGQEQIAGEVRAAGHVREDTQRGADHHRRHDREPVEPVRQIDRIAGADDDAEGERDESPHAERIGHGLEERHDEVGLGTQIDVEAAAHPCGQQSQELRVVRRGHRERKVDRGDQADQRLPEELGARRQALRIPVHDLAPVVGPADGTEAHGHEQDDPDEAVGEIAPEQRGDHDRNQDQCAPHRRRAGLDEVGLRAVIAHRLADFHARQPRDHSRADHE